MRFLYTNTTPESIERARQAEAENDKKISRSCACIDIGRENNGRAMTFGQRLSLGFRMLKDFFEP